MNKKMVHQFEKLISKTVELGANKIILRNSKNNVCVANILLKDKEVNVQENNEGLLFCEMIFNILKSNPNEQFSTINSQNGKVQYIIGNIDKEIIFKSTIEDKEGFSIVLSLS